MNTQTKETVVKTLVKNGYKVKGRLVHRHLCVALYDPYEAIWTFTDVNTDKLVAIAEDFNLTIGVAYFDEEVRTHG